MNATMKKILNIVGLAVILVMLFCLIPQDADAASYQGGSLFNFSDQSPRFKIGTSYFWTDSNGTALCCAASSDGEPTVLFQNENYYVDQANILSNNSTVYFMATNAETRTVVFYRVNMDGTGLKKVKSFKASDNTYYYYQLVSVYNNNLFYWKYGDKDSGDPSCLYSIGLKSGTVKKRISEFWCEFSSGGGRYIYYSRDNSDGSFSLRAYDCKNFKGLSVATNANAIGSYDGKMYYYKVVYSDGDYSTRKSKIYRCTLSGKEDKLIKTLTDANCSKIKNGKIYYYTGGWGPHDYYYYDLKTKKSVSITEEKFKAA